MIFTLKHGQGIIKFRCKMSEIDQFGHKLNTCNVHITRMTVYYRTDIVLTNNPPDRNSSRLDG